MNDLRRTILGLLLLLAVGGCASPNMGRSAMAPYRPAVAHPAIITTTSNEPIREAAATELGPEAAQDIAPIDRPAPQLVDPGAAALVQSMLARMGDRVIGAGDGGGPKIGMSQLRNQSRATSQEFSAFCERLTSLLNRAAKASGISGSKNMRFTCDETEAVDYQLQGTAYVVSAQGFDVWELFLSLSPAEKNWTIWEAGGPVRVLRQPRPGQPQILIW